MSGQWTFRRSLGASFGLLVLLTVLVGTVAFVALHAAVRSKDAVIDVGIQALVGAQEIATLRHRKGSDAREFLLTGRESAVVDMRAARTELLATLGRLRQALGDSERQRLIEAIAGAEEHNQLALEDLVSRRRRGAPTAELLEVFATSVDPTAARLDGAVRAFVAHERDQIRRAAEQSRLRAGWTSVLLVGLTGLAIVAAIAAGALITNRLVHQIGTAVGDVQNSSAELQAVATQQATGAKQQSTAMAEIATTMSELLASSGQIAESARRVAQIAESTAGAAGSGDRTVLRAQEAISAIQRQVEQVVTHMLELGRKSQQVGTVVEIVSELAEQTNIVAINATIEAAGAGEHGRRFAVVADEIRKLADRVTSSTKEVRGLIEDVRSAVNTTVMATESGSKAVETGSRHFADVTSAFEQINGLVAATSDAAREIELSIKQQMTAVEQVSGAVVDIAQAARETETSTAQTQQTAAQLTRLSSDLLRIASAQPVS